MTPQVTQVLCGVGEDMSQSLRIGWLFPVYRWRRRLQRAQWLPDLTASERQNGVPASKAAPFSDLPLPLRKPSAGALLSLQHRVTWLGFLQRVVQVEGMIQLPGPVASAFPEQPSLLH